MPAFVIPSGGGRAFIPEGKVKLELGQSPDFAILESELPAEWEGPPPHVHRIYDEAFYVLDGAVVYVLDGEPRTCSAGSFVFVPRGVAHGFSNPEEAPARILVITTPAAIQLVEGATSLMGLPGPPDFVKLGEPVPAARHRDHRLGPGGWWVVRPFTIQGVTGV